MAPKHGPPALFQLPQLPRPPLAVRIYNDPLVTNLKPLTRWNRGYLPNLIFVPQMPGMLSSVNAPTCPTHMFYLDFFLLCLLTFTISSKYLFPTFPTILSLYNFQIGNTRTFDLYDLPSLVCLLFNFARNFDTSQVMGLWLTQLCCFPPWAPGLNVVQLPDAAFTSN
jgi:hypothetical protein